MARRRDPMEIAIESALHAGRFIAWNQESAFVAGLEEVERDIAALASDASFDGRLGEDRTFIEQRCAAGAYGSARLGAAAVGRRPIEPADRRQRGCGGEYGVRSAQALRTGRLGARVV